MSWFEKHVHTIILNFVLATFFVWVHAKFDNLKRDVASLKQEVTVIKTVLITRQIMPCELAEKRK